MKNRIATLAALAACGAQAPARAETHTYDFGTESGYILPLSATPKINLPIPASGSVGAAMGNGGGAVELNNPGNPAIGSGSEARITAPYNATYNRFRIRDYAAGTTGAVSMVMQFGSASSGFWYMLVGDGGTFSNTYTGSYIATDIFAGIRWTHGTGSTLAAETFDGTNWVAAPSLALTEADIVALTLVMNNTGSTAGYPYTDGTSYFIPPGCWDLWINGVRTAALPGGGLASGGMIDSFMVSGSSSAGNAATLTIDDIVYRNDFATLPVELDRFSVK